MIIINTEEAVSGKEAEPLCIAEPSLRAYAHRTLLPPPLCPHERPVYTASHSVLFHSGPVAQRNLALLKHLRIFHPSQTALLASIPLSPPDSFSKAKNELLG